MSGMALLRGCRLNAALTIQLFSKLFHFLNVWAFNRLVAPNSIYCSKVWGTRIKNRLAHIQIWAERQGLELAADCHLAKLMQAAHLLQVNDWGILYGSVISVFIGDWTVVNLADRNFDAGILNVNAYY